MRARAMPSSPRTSCMRTGSSMRWMASVWCETGTASGRVPTMRPMPASPCSPSPRPAIVTPLGSRRWRWCGLAPMTLARPWRPVHPGQGRQLKPQFTDAYRKLLVGLRERLGPKGLIIVIQPAFGDNPANQKVAAIVDSLRSAGDQRLYTLQFPALELTGCNGHPNLSDHRLMGATLVKFIEEHGGADLH